MSFSLKPQSRQSAIIAPAKAAWLRLIQRCWNHAVRRWKRRKMIAALSGLDDRTLQDIGLWRGGIEDFVDSLSCAELRMAPIARQAAPEPQPASCADLRRAA